MAVMEKDLEHVDIKSAAFRPVISSPRWFWLAIVLLALPVAWGVAAWATQVIYGLGVTGLSDQVFWGLYIANLVTFIGFSYGGALVSAILRLTGAGWRAPITRLAEATALVTLLVGALFVLPDLGRPERVWQFFTSPNWSSPLIWDFIAISTYLAATVVFLYLPLIPDLAAGLRHFGERLRPWQSAIYRRLSLGWSDTPSQQRALGWGMTTMAILIIPIAVMVHSVLSWVFALTTRAGWHSTIFGPYFVVAALFSGVAMVILVVLAFRKLYRLEGFIGERHIRNLGYIMVTLGATYLYFTFSELLTEGYPLMPKTTAWLEVLFTGPYGLWYAFFVLAGGVLPVLLVALPKTRNAWGIGIGAALVILAMTLKRLLIVVPPLSVPTAGGEAVFYQPTWVEIAMTVGGLAAIPLMLLLFFRVFPVLGIHEMEEVETTSAHGAGRG